jgi:prophage antirepressor-like protein
MLQSFTKENFTINVYGTPEQPYFKAREIALLLGYKKPANAIAAHVEVEDKKLIKDFEGVPGIRTP